MDNRRLLLASALSLVVVILWSFLFSPPPAQPPPPSQESSTPPPAETVGQTADAAGSPFDTAPEASIETLAPEDGGIEPPAEGISADHEELRTLENERLTATFSNRGGQLLSLRLVNQLDEEGQPLEMVRRRGRDPYPLAFLRQGRIHPLNDALFEWQEVEDPAAAGRQLLLRYRGELGTAEKRIELLDDGTLEIDCRVAGDDWGLMLGPGQRDLGTKEEDSRYLLSQAAYLSGDSREELKPGKHEEDVQIGTGGLRWVSLEDNYFVSALVPIDGVREVIVKPVVQRPGVVEGSPRFLPVGTVIEGEELSDQQLLIVNAGGDRMRLVGFFGAKRYDRLSQLPYELGKTLDWGFFGVLARPLYWGLKWIYDEIVPNWGWAIVLMTVLIKLLFTPLTHKSQKSMQKMQLLNPKVQAIRAKYRNRLKDKQGRPNLDMQRKMNEETMAVYKQAGVNPAGGCFPILLQFPVFLAFYRLLSAAVELRAAPWLGWIADLSAPDPYWILPAALLGSGVLLQKMTPPPPDPMQRRLMQFMPIMFSVFAISFPSGLVLYWVTNNLLTMLHQRFLSKGLHPAAGDGAAPKDGEARKEAKA